MAPWDDRSVGKMSPEQGALVLALMHWIGKHLPENLIHVLAGRYNLHNLVMHDNHFEPNSTRAALPMKVSSLIGGQAVEGPAGRGVAAPAVNPEILNLLGDRVFTCFAKIGAEFFG